MVEQLQAIVGYTIASRTPVAAIVNEKEVGEKKSKEKSQTDAGDGNEFTDILKTRIDTLDFSTRTLNALSGANIRTIGGVARKKKEDLLEIEGIGEKGIQEIKKVLAQYNLTLK